MVDHDAKENGMFLRARNSKQNTSSESNLLFYQHDERARNICDLIDCRSSRPCYTDDYSADEIRYMMMYAIQTSTCLKKSSERRETGLEHINSFKDTTDSPLFETQKIRLFPLDSICKDRFSEKSKLASYKNTNQNTNITTDQSKFSAVSVIQLTDDCADITVVDADSCTKHLDRILASGLEPFLIPSSNGNSDSSQKHINQSATNDITFHLHPTPKSVESFQHSSFTMPSFSMESQPVQMVSAPSCSQSDNGQLSFLQIIHNGFPVQQMSKGTGKNSSMVEQEDNARAKNFDLTFRQKNRHNHQDTTLSSRAVSALDQYSTAAMSSTATTKTTTTTTKTPIAGRYDEVIRPAERIVSCYPYSTDVLSINKDEYVGKYLNAKDNVKLGGDNVRISRDKQRHFDQVDSSFLENFITQYTEKQNKNPRLCTRTASTTKPNQTTSVCGQAQIQTVQKILKTCSHETHAVTSDGKPENKMTSAHSGYALEQAGGSNLSNSGYCASPVEMLRHNIHNTFPSVSSSSHRHISKVVGVSRCKGLSPNQTAVTENADSDNLAILLRLIGNKNYQPSCKRSVRRWTEKSPLASFKLLSDDYQSRGLITSSSLQPFSSKRSLENSSDYCSVLEDQVNPSLRVASQNYLSSQVNSVVHDYHTTITSKQQIADDTPNLLDCISSPIMFCSSPSLCKFSKCPQQNTSNSAKLGSSNTNLNWLSKQDLSIILEGINSTNATSLTINSLSAGSDESLVSSTGSVPNLYTNPQQCVSKFEDVFNTQSTDRLLDTETRRSKKPKKTQRKKKSKQCLEMPARASDEQTIQDFQHAVGLLTNLQCINEDEANTNGSRKQKFKQADNNIYQEETSITNYDKHLNELLRSIDDNDCCPYSLLDDSSCDVSEYSSSMKPSDRGGTKFQNDLSKSNNNNNGISNCVCRLLPMVMCLRCGALCHSDCISTDSLCSHCVENIDVDKVNGVHLKTNVE